MEDVKKVRLEFEGRLPDEMLRLAEGFYEKMKKRRSVRDFSERFVPREVIEDCVKAAGTAPSGANCQPWHFVVVSEAEVKRQIQVEAEKVEAAFYVKESNRQWIEDLKHLGTTEKKPFLEEAPYLIVVFSQTYGLTPEGEKINHYYVHQSVGIAVGFLIAAIHNAGLACVPYTPAPATFLNKILNRPENERAFCVLPVGYPVAGTCVPAIEKKPFDEVCTFF
jgi:iodotyrosine deiodinase